MNQPSRTRGSSARAARLLGTLAVTSALGLGCTDAYYDYGAAWGEHLVDLELPNTLPDYGQYTTFAFNRVSQGGSNAGPFSRPYVATAREELSESLEFLGYVAVDLEDGPDLVVNYYDQIEERYAYVNGEYYYCAYSWQWHYPCSTYTETRYHVGTVVLDIRDASTEKSVWRVVGEGVITDDARQLDQRVRAAIDRAIDISPESFLAGPGGDS